MIETRHLQHQINAFQYRPSSWTLRDRTNMVLMGSLTGSTGWHCVQCYFCQCPREGWGHCALNSKMHDGITHLWYKGIWALSTCSLIANSGTDLLETKWSKKRCNPMFIAAKPWKLPKFPLTEESIEKTWHIYTMEYHSAIKKRMK